MTTKRKQDLKKEIVRLRKRYDLLRARKNVWIDAVKRHRTEMAKYTFADLDSRGKNPYFKSLRNKERKCKQHYLITDNQLDKVDRKISELLNKRK